MSAAERRAAGEAPFSDSPRMVAVIQAEARDFAADGVLHRTDVASVSIVLRALVVQALLTWSAS